jgi:hypothetical protein
MLSDRDHSERKKMASGHEKLHRVSEVLGTFEEAVVALANKGITQSETPLQQDIDRARRAVVEEVVKLVTEARLEGQSD